MKRTVGCILPPSCHLLVQHASPSSRPVTMGYSLW
jgi:hypothetical protein